MRRVPLIAAAVLVCVMAVLLARAANQPVIAPTNDHILRIGVINVTNLLNQMQEFKKLKDDIHNKLVDLTQEQRKQEQAIQEKQSHRDNTFKPGTAQWQSETDQIDKMNFELEVWKNMSTVQLDRWKKQYLKSVYDHIAGAAQQVAQNQQLDLVIADTTPQFGPDMDKVRSQELELALSMRNVYYAGPKADVTDKVLMQLEADFSKAQPAAAH